VTEMEELLRVEGLNVVYRHGRRRVHAVRQADLKLAPGESVGLVGESGCGKSSLARALLFLIAPSSGRISYCGRQVNAGDKRDVQEYRRSVQMVFQDPHGSLNPRMTVGEMVSEVFRVVHGLHREESRRRSLELLETVGLEAALAERYPHELSGGQRQRVGLARALAVEPRVLIADEPVSALDVSVQAQILNLIRGLQATRRLGLLFISHDLAVVGYMCRRVYVMYSGEIVEEGPVEEVYADPAHPYTRLLLAAVPDLERPLAGGEESGEAAPAPQEPAGCSFFPRCRYRMERCAREHPELLPVGEGRRSRCFAAGKLGSERPGSV